MTIFSEHYSKELSGAGVAIYKAGLSDIGTDELNEACSNALRECRFMPTVADIRAHLKQKTAIALTMASEAEWQRALRASAQFNPEVGATSPAEKDWKGRPAWSYQPKLTAAGEHAVRCAGGWSALYRVWCDSADAPFVQKKFIAAYDNFAAGEHIGITEGEAERLLDRVRGERKLLGVKQ